MDATRGTSATARRDPVVVVTGGGTSGHVHPALAVLEAMEDSGWSRDSLHYVGCTRGVESQMLPREGYSYTLLDVRGFVHSASPRAIVRNVVTALGQWRARREAIRLLRSLSASVVVSLGGYASVPASAAAVRLGVPLVVCSYDGRPGRATRLASRRARVCCVADLPSTLPRARLTGAPVRRSIRSLDRAAARDAARSALGFPLDRPLVALVGGSLGSPALNAAVEELIEALSPRVAILALEGERHRAEESIRRDESGVVVVRRVATIRPIVDLYAAADVLICRAGASTLAEVAVTGTPAIVVPWPDAADDHQRANAAVLARAGAALVVEEGPNLAADLVREVSGLLSDDARRAALAAAAARHGERHRGTGVADVVREVVMSAGGGLDRQG